MPGQVYAPVAVTPQSSKNSRTATSSDLFASLNTLQSKDNKLATPVRKIQERDWTVPAPPPPSPVSFHPDHWQYAMRR